MFNCVLEIGHRAVKYFPHPIFLTAHKQDLTVHTFFFYIFDIATQIITLYDKSLLNLFVTQNYIHIDT